MTLDQQHEIRNGVVCSWSILKRLERSENLDLDAVRLIEHLKQQIERIGQACEPTPCRR